MPKSHDPHEFRALWTLAALTHDDVVNDYSKYSKAMFAFGFGIDIDVVDRIFFSGNSEHTIVSLLIQEPFTIDPTQ